MKKAMLIACLFVAIMILVPSTIVAAAEIESMTEPLADDGPPYVKIIKPKPGIYTGNDFWKSFPIPIPVAAIFGHQLIDIKVDAADDDGIEMVEFYIDGRFEAADYSEPYGMRGVPLFIHILKVIAYDNAGNSATDWILTIGMTSFP